MFSQGSGILSPVTSSGARFYAVLKIRGKKTHKTRPEVKLQQEEVEPGVPGPGPGPVTPGAGTWPLCRRVQLGETCTDKYPNSPKLANFSSVNRTVPGLQGSGTAFRGGSSPTAEPRPKPDGQFWGALPGYSLPPYAAPAPQSSRARSSSLAWAAPGGARQRPQGGAG